MEGPYSSQSQLHPTGLSPVTSSLGPGSLGMEAIELWRCVEVTFLTPGARELQ